MKWVLVDKYDNIVSKAELHSGYGKDAAKMYFVGRKQIEENEFDKLWKVMTKSDYDRSYEANLRPPSSQHIRWWEDIGEKSDLDEW